jgi:predicted house-cleaning noncanonical NTP pyrophosphatase (MazG superfamily)
MRNKNMSDISRYCELISMINSANNFNRKWHDPIFEIRSQEFEELENEFKELHYKIWLKEKLTEKNGNTI